MNVLFVSSVRMYSLCKSPKRGKKFNVSHLPLFPMIPLSNVVINNPASLPEGSRCIDQPPYC